MNEQNCIFNVLNAIERNYMEQKKDALLPNVTWKFVDGQYVLYTCNVLTQQDSLARQLSEKKHDTVRDILRESVLEPFRTF